MFSAMEYKLAIQYLNKVTIFDEIERESGSVIMLIVSGTERQGGTLYSSSFLLSCLLSLMTLSP